MIVVAPPVQTSAFAGVGLPPDARLDRSLAVEEPLADLPDLLARLGKAAGATLTVQKRLAVLKATVLTPARPVRLTLGALASVFEARWVAVPGGYRLEETVPALSRRRATLAAIEEMRRAEAERALAGWGTYARLRAESAEVRRLFWSGRFYGWSEAGRGRISSFLTDAEGGAPLGPPATVALDAPDLNLVRYVPATGEAGSVGTVRFGVPVRRYAPAIGKVYDLPFERALQGWATDPAREDVPELERETAPANPKLPAPNGAAMTEPDALALLHRASGVPVVAWGSRLRRGRTFPPFIGEPLREALRFVGPSGGVRFEAGTLLFRPREAPFLFTEEPSEAAFALFEGKERGTAEGAAAMLAGLDRTQVAGLGRRVFRRDFSPYLPAAYELRAWGRLEAAGRDRVLAGGEVALGSLPGPAREAAEDAVVEAIFAAPDEGVPRFIGGVPPVLLRHAFAPDREPLALAGRGDAGWLTLRIAPPGTPEWALQGFKPDAMLDGKPVYRAPEVEPGLLAEVPLVVGGR